MGWIFGRFLMDFGLNFLIDWPFFDGFGVDFFWIFDLYFWLFFDGFWVECPSAVAGFAALRRVGYY